MTTDTRVALKRCPIHLMTVSLLTAFMATAHAQPADSLRAAIHIANSYRVAANVTYLEVGNIESKLDVYQSRTATTPNATLIWIHGGNWVGGSKEASTISLLPFLEMGWNVVNVEYRLLGVAPAPAAAEDCRCALGWIYEHAKDYNIDPNRLVVSGNSAGGHLSLLTGMAPADAGLDTQCPSARQVKAAAIINWYGFPSLADLVEGPNARAPVGAWLGNAPNRMELAKRLSPMTYVRNGGPPVISVHGDADPTSPYEFAVRFHEALKKAGVPNELVTVPGGKHGGFSDEESLGIYKAITAFLTRQNVQKGPSAEP
jgi:acetyl esterase/lipase